MMFLISLRALLAEESLDISWKWEDYLDKWI